MNRKVSFIEDKAEVIANYIGYDFLNLAEELRDLQDAKPDIFMTVVKMAGLSTRKAYALARISRQFDDLGVPDERLHAIGWTKLQVIGRHLTEENADYLLNLAEHNTVHDLEALLRGERLIEDARVMVLYFSPEEHDLVRGALIRHGAVANGKGLLKKEAALIALISMARLSERPSRKAKRS